MSYEGRAISAFEGLEAIEQLAERVRLQVRTAADQEENALESGEVLRVAPEEARRAGLTLNIDWGIGEIEQAVAEADLRFSDIALVVVADEGFLKERCILWGPCPLNEVHERIVLAAYKQARPRALENTIAGFTIDACLVLRTSHLPRALRPYRKGTILGSSRFTIRTTGEAAGLDPKPLTEEEISRFNLLPSTLLYLDYESPLVEHEHLSGNLDVYINEKILSSADHHRGDERDAVIGGLALEAISQIVHIAASELDDLQWFKPSESAVLRMLRQLLVDGVGLKCDSEEDVAEMVKQNPSRVAGLISGAYRRANGLLRVIEGHDEPSGEGEA